MGNVCCSGTERSKLGALDNGVNTSFGEDDKYDTDAKAKEAQLERAMMAKSMQRSCVMNELDDEDFRLTPASRKNRPGGRAKRQSITSTPMDMDISGYTAPSFPKTPEITEFLLEAMGNNFVFDTIDEETKLQFVNAMQSQKYAKGEMVIKQGDVGDYFYIVEGGTVDYLINATDGGGEPQKVGEGKRGSTFGELALLYNTPRAASVRAATMLDMYKIDQISFKSLLMASQVQDRTNLMALVENLKVFEGLDEDKKLKLADAFTIVDFGPGERIVNKGDHGNVLYVVKSGKVKVEDIGHGSSVYQDLILEEGDCFGERALITGETRAANVSAATASSLLAISKEVLEEIIGPLEQATKHSTLARLLGSIPLFANLEPPEINNCVKFLKEENFKEGDKISTTEGKLYLVEEGDLLMTTQKDGESALLKFSGGDYFIDIWGRNAEPKVADEKEGKEGEAKTTEKEANSSGGATINVEADAKCLTLLTSELETIVMGDMKRVMLEIDSSAESKEAEKKGPMSRRGLPGGQSGRSVLQAMQRQSMRSGFIKEKKTTANRDVMNLSKLTKYRILGQGTFGKVWLVTPKSNAVDKPTPYALKMVAKRQLLEQNLAAAVLREKNVMESINHPFLLRMESAFQDENYLYFVMDLILGGELFELLYPEDDVGEFKDDPAWKESSFFKIFGDAVEKPISGTAGVGVRKALFYSACVIDAFHYLHDRRIVYRDLKPENVMLNEKGYCVVVDMGFAKVVCDKTYTVCGTPEYLAPEIIASKGHNHVADYWSFACLLYELIVGGTPFFAPGLDQLGLLKKIVKANYSFPSEIEKLSLDESSNDLEKALCHWKDLVSLLLKPKSVERLGNLRNGIEDILHHDWFAKVSFNEFRTQSTPAPWLPSVTDPMANSGKGSAADAQPETFKKKLSAEDQAAFRGF